MSENSGQESPKPAGPPAAAAGGRPKFVTLGFSSFQMWKISGEWRRQDAGTRARQVEGFIKACEAASGPEVKISAFSTAGLKSACDFILWTKAKSLEQIHALGLAQAKSDFTRHNEITFNYLAMLKGSPYEQKEHGFVPEEEYKFLFVYPFVKTRDWYMLPLEERIRIMRGHTEKSGPYKMVRINTSYSFGIDDQDFVVAFESNTADDFVNLVQDLRETESSKYTARDTPMYVGVKSNLKDILAIY